MRSTDHNHLQPLGFPLAVHNALRFNHSVVRHMHIGLLRFKI